MTVALKESATRLDADVPKALFSALLRAGGRNRYLVSPDGKKFLAVTQPEAASSLPTTIVLNWAAGIKR